MVGSLGTSLAAWLLLPAVVYLLATGLGLLVERLTRFALPGALLAPVGLLAAIVLVMPGYRAGVGAGLAVPLACIAALAGLVLARRELPGRLNPGAAGAAAGLGVYALYLAPVFLAGGWTWTGYNFVNDTAVQFLLADHLGSDGATIPLGPPGHEPLSTGVEHVRVYLEGAYPLGMHALLATLDPLVPAPLPAIYQPVISLSAAFGAMALVPLARRAGLPAAAAAVAAAAALAASLAFNYALQGNAKEVAMLASIGIAAAVAREALAKERSLGGVAVVALCLSGSLALFSAAAVPYVGAFALFFLVAAFFQAGPVTRRWLVQATAVAAVVLALASASTLVDIVHFGEAASANFTEGNPAGDFGQLVRPLRLAQTAGIWLGDDYRFPATEDAPNKALILLAVGALAAGLLWLWRRRESGPLLYLATVGLALAVLTPRVSPYATGKMLAIASPAIVLGVAVGLYALWSWAGRLLLSAPLAPRLARGAAALAAVAVAGGIAVSDGMAYRAVRLAPIDRMEALEDVGDRYAGNRFVLLDDFEEFAKYFMGDTRENVALELVTPYPARTALLRSFQALHADLDQMPLEYTNVFDVVVQRRGADTSRPPAAFERDYENRYYTAWVRRRDVRVERHVPLQELYTRTAAAPCDTLAELARDARAAGDGDRIVAAHAPERVRLDPIEAGVPPNWQADPTVPNALRALTPGRVADDLRFEGGSYRIWVLGSFGRHVELRVDGRTVGDARGVNTPGEWLEGGSVRLDGGEHRVELVRGGAGLGPGNRFIGALGPVVFERIERDGDRLEWLRPGQAERLCGRELDWVELARRG